MLIQSRKIPYKRFIAGQLEWFSIWGRDVSYTDFYVTGIPSENTWNGFTYKHAPVYQTILQGI